MEYVTYYVKSEKWWYGYWQTFDGKPLGGAVDARTKESLLIELGTIKKARKMEEEGKYGTSSWY